MEFFEAIKTFIIATHASESGFEEIAGTKLSDEFFAYKEEGKTLHPEARWIISDIASGRALPRKGVKGAVLRFATLKDCKDWVADMPEEYRQKIDEVKAMPEYAEACQALDNFRNSKIETESFDFNEAFEALNDLYEEIDQEILEFNLEEKKHKDSKQNNAAAGNRNWKDYFMQVSDLGISLDRGMFIPLISNEFAGAFDDFRDTWSGYDLSKLVEKLNRAIVSFDTSGRPRAMQSEKVNGVDHPIFELKLGETSAKKPIRALYFTKRDEDGTRYVILASLFIHTDKNLSATERNSGRNAYFLANPRD